MITRIKWLNIAALLVVGYLLISWLDVVMGGSEWAWNLFSLILRLGGIS